MVLFFVGLEKKIYYSPDARFQCHLCRTKHKEFNAFREHKYQRHDILLFDFNGTELRANDEVDNPDGGGVDCDNDDSDRNESKNVCDKAKSRRGIPPVLNRLFFCDICHRSFADLRLLESHIKEKHYFSHWCDQGFNQLNVFVFLFPSSFMPVLNILIFLSCQCITLATGVIRHRINKSNAFISVRLSDYIYANLFFCLYHSV